MLFEVIENRFLLTASMQLVEIAVLPEHERGDDTADFKVVVTVVFVLIILGTVELCEAHLRPLLLGLDRDVLEWFKEILAVRAPIGIKGDQSHVVLVDGRLEVVLD